MSRLWRWDSNCRVMFLVCCPLSTGCLESCVECQILSNLLLYSSTERNWTNAESGAQLEPEFPKKIQRWAFSSNSQTRLGAKTFFSRGAVTRQETKQNNFFRASCSRIVQGDLAASIFCQFSNLLGAKTIFFFHFQVWRHVEFERGIGAARLGTARQDIKVLSNLLFQNCPKRFSSEHSLPVEKSLGAKIFFLSWHAAVISTFRPAGQTRQETNTR